MLKRSKKESRYGIIFLIVAAWFISSAAATTVSIGSNSSSPGGTAIVPLMITGVTGVGGAQINITFDPAIVNIVNTTEGNFDLKPTDPPTNRGIDWVVVQVGQINTGLSGTVKVADITLKAIGASGQSNLTIHSAILSDIHQLNIPVDTVINGAFTITLDDKPKGIINGTVTNNSGSPVIGATVTANGHSDITDSRGEYEISIAQGTYTVTVNAEGYQTNSTAGVIVTSGSTVTVNFELQPDTTPANPDITGWSNNKTNNDSLDITINADESVLFTAVADQIIDTWNWFLDNVLQSNNAPSFTVGNLAAGTSHTISVNATNNTNGNSGTITWNIVVEPEVTDANGTITGTVTSASSGLPIPGANVHTDGHNNVTDSDGNYTIVIGAGTYTLTATAANYIENSTTVTVMGDQTVIQDFALESPALTIMPSQTFVIVNTSTNVTFTVTNGSIPVNGATVTLSGNATGSNTTDINGQAIINVNASSAGIITAIASKTDFINGTTTMQSFPIGTVVMSIGTATIMVGQQVTLPVTFTNANEIAGGSVKIVFDPAVVNISTVGTGDFPDSFMYNIDNTNGSVSVAGLHMGGVPSHPTAINNSTAILANLTFNGISTGTSAVSLQDTFVNGEVFEILSVTVNGSMTVKPLPLAVSVDPTTVTVGMSTQVTATVTSSGAPVSGAIVNLSGPGVSNTSTTGSDGKVIFNNVNATGEGTITVTASKTNYMIATYSITASTQTILMITASPTSVEVAKTTGVRFTVTGESTKIAGATVTLSGAAIGNGATDSDGNVTIYVTPISTGTIIATASKANYLNGTTTVGTFVIVTPASGTNLKAISAGMDFINWTWNNPSNLNYTEVRLDGVFRENIDKRSYYNATGLANGTVYTIEIRFIYQTGSQENATDTAMTARTLLVLEPGWNLISVPFRLADFDTLAPSSTPFTGNANIDKVLTYSGSDGVLVFNPQIEPLYSYWVNSSANTGIGVPLFNLSVAKGAGGSSQPTKLIALSLGWNMVGPTGMIPMSALDMLVTPKDNVVRVAGYDRSSNEYEIDTTPDISITMNPTEGFWVLVSRESVYDGDGSIR